MTLVRISTIEKKCRSATKLFEPTHRRYTQRVEKVKPEDTRVFFEDQSLLVIDKPAGVLAHPSPKDRATTDIISLLHDRFGKLHPVHRLDRLTTGIMVLARDSATAEVMAAQFRDRRVSKHYLALVRGHTPPSGTIDAPMRTGRAFTERTDGPKQPAHTDYTTLAKSVVGVPLGRYQEAWFSLVEVTLHTGRTHQARRHLSRINHPVVGDKHHGDYAYNRFLEAKLGERYLFLRAHRIGFTHPDGRRLRVTAALPEAWITGLTYVSITPPPLADSVGEEPVAQ